MRGAADIFEKSEFPVTPETKNSHWFKGGKSVITLTTLRGYKWALVNLMLEGNSAMSQVVPHPRSRGEKKYPCRSILQIPEITASLVDHLHRTCRLNLALFQSIFHFMCSTQCVGFIHYVCMRLLCNLLKR